MSQSELGAASRLRRFAAACDMLNDDQLLTGMVHQLGRRPGVEHRLAVLFQNKQQPMDATASAISSEVEVVCDEAEVAKAKATEAVGDARDAHWKAIVEMQKTEAVIPSILPGFEQKGKVLLGGLSDARSHLLKDPSARGAAAALTALGQALVDARPLPKQAHDAFQAACRCARDVVV